MMSNSQRVEDQPIKNEDGTVQEPIPYDKEKDPRYTGLGEMRILSDCFILEKIFGELSMRSLCKAALISKAFYVFATEDEIWKTKCLDKYEGKFTFNQTWKLTTLEPKRRNQNRKKFERLVVKGFYSEYLYRKWYRSNVDVQNFTTDAATIDVRHVDNLTVEEFNKEYKEQNKPVIIEGIIEKWPAHKNWTLQNLIEKYGETKFKTDEPDNDGSKIKMKLNDYIIYCHEQHDEDPTYIFEPGLHRRNPELLKDWQIPEYFPEDFFNCLSQSDRPRYRWMLMGPARTGAPFHVDPYKTSAWNALLVGHKRWTLYPPNVLPPGVTWTWEKDGSVDFDSPEPVKWFIENYPMYYKDNYPAANGYPRPLEITQKPGQLIFVPTGWWHQVLNLDFTVACTQNFMDMSNFDIVYRDMAHPSNKRLFKRFRKHLLEVRPDLVERGDKVCADIPFFEPTPELTLSDLNKFAE